MRKGERGWLIAIAPGALVFSLEGLVWAAAAATHSTAPARIGSYVLVLGAVAALAAPLAIGITEQRDAWLWAVFSVLISFFGLGIGLLFWWLAALANCGPNCLS